MHAQRSWFTLHGDDPRPLNQIITGRGAGRILRHIDLAPAAVEEARDFLETSGINAYSPFPDLDGLSRQLHHKYKIAYQ